MIQTELFDSEKYGLCCVVYVVEQASNIVFAEYLEGLWQLDCEHTQLIFAACEGLPNAPQYDSADFNGKAIWELADEIKRDSVLVAGFDSDGMARVAEGSEAAQKLLSGTEDLDLNADPNGAQKRKNELIAALKNHLNTSVEMWRNEVSELPQMRLLTDYGTEIFLMKAMSDWVNKNANKFNSIQIRALLCEKNLAKTVALRSLESVYTNRIDLVLSNAFANVAYENLTYGKKFLVSEEKKRIVEYAQNNRDNSHGKYILRQMEKNPYPDFATVRRIYNKVFSMSNEDSLTKAPRKKRTKSKGRVR